MVMLYMTVIVVGLLGMLVLRLLLPRLIGEGYQLAGPRRAMALVVALSGLLIGVYGADQLVESWERRHWSTVEATVIRSELVGGRNYRPEVELEYAVAGGTYRVVSNLGATGFGSKRSRYDVGKHLIADYPPGHRVQMHYDPEDPASAVLLVRPSFQSFVLVAVGVLLIAIGGGLASLGSYREAHEDESIAAGMGGAGGESQS